jgi:hypothetical protein
MLLIIPTHNFNSYDRSYAKSNLKLRHIRLSVRMCQGQLHLADFQEISYLLLR